MATDVDQAYYGWSHEELSDHGESQEVSVSQMLDHGSISFGRFAFESLEWERRSVFTHNKCQEELEKFKSPGLVAQKKAYFEKYYKRIRALKATQHNQQTELTLDYGGDGSISSQTGEADETAVQIESLGDGASKVIDAHSKEASIQVTLEKNHNCEAIQIRHLDLEPASSNLDSSRKGSVEIDQEKNNSYALQMQHLDMGPTLHESLIRTEEIEQHDLSGVDNKGISRKHDNSGSIIRQQKNSTDDVQINHFDKGFVGHESSIRRTEEIEQNELSGLDVKGISRKHDNLESTIKLEVAAGGTVLYPTNPNVEDSELKPDYNIVSEKPKPNVMKYKEDRMPVSKVKGPAASVGNGLKLESKTRLDIKSLLGPNYPFQKTISQTKNNVGSSNTTADRVSRNYKSTPVTKHRPLTEVRSNVTIPRPFSFATERRSAVTVGIRDGASRLGSKTSNRLGSSLNQAKDVTNVHDTSKKAARIYGVKSRGLENKRGCEEVRKIDLTFDRQCTSLKGRGVNVPEPPKARISRSMNLPARNLSNPLGGSEYRSINAVRQDKQEEGKEDARLREVRVIGAKIGTPRTGNLKAERKKVPPSPSDHLSLNGRRPRTGGLSHDGTKPRQEMPRWR